jgi:hypothetical protein
MITLGIAASISIIKDAGPVNHFGASSTRKMAAPRLIGTAMSRPMAEVSNVPYIAGRAPNTSLTGFHVELVKKANPNLVIAGMASLTKITSKPTRIATITNAKKKVRLEKILSLNSERRLSFQLFILLDTAIFPGFSFFTKFSFRSFSKTYERKMLDELQLPF